MNIPAPSPNSGDDAALSNLIDAALGTPETSCPSTQDNTLTRTGNTADHQAAWFAGMEQGQANERHNAQIRTQAEPRPYGSPADLAQRIEQYIGRYGREDTSTLLLYEAMKVLRTPAALALPELNADLIDILGRSNFTCIRLAQLLRLSGVEIATKAEAEQATVILYLLGFYLKHGNHWAEKASEDLERRRLAASAVQQDNAGRHV
ncbi:MAG: hypothetical protein ACN6PR_00030 [Achromobacter sp.]